MDYRINRIKAAVKNGRVPMGINIQSSGIGVDRSKYYLFNMSSDPSMSALLLYYLKVKLDSMGLSIHHSL